MLTFGGLDNRGVPEPLAAALTRRLLDMPANPVAEDVVPHPEVWDELCGWYAMDAGPNTHLSLRIGFGSGLEVAGRHDHLMLMPLQPVPGVSAAMVMHPDDPQDPRVFRVEFEQYETSRIVFTRDTPPRLLVDVMSFQTRPDWTNPRRFATGVAVGGPAVAARRYAGAAICMTVRHTGAGSMIGPWLGVVGPALSVGSGWFTSTDAVELSSRSGPHQMGYCARAKVRWL